MYNLEWFSNFEGYSKGERMDLHKFVLFYDEYIAEKDYIYFTESDSLSSFVIESRKNQLPHLMALQHWNNLSVKQASKQYQHLYNGDWDIPYLRKADEGAYDDHRSRIEGLPYLYNMLYKFECDIKIVNSGVRNPFTNRKMDMIFHKDGQKLIYVLELREKRTNVFVPTSTSVYRKLPRGKYYNLTIKNVVVNSI